MTLYSSSPILFCMKIINSKEEFNKFYYYSKSGYKPKKYPTEYPCVCKIETGGGGLAGEYEAHYAVYFPKTESVTDAFISGLNTEWEYIC